MTNSLKSIANDASARYADPILADYSVDLDSAIDEFPDELTVAPRGWWCPSRFHHSEDIAVWADFANRRVEGQTVTVLYRQLLEFIASRNAAKSWHDHYLLPPSRSHFRAIVNQSMRVH